MKKLLLSIAMLAASFAAVAGRSADSSEQLPANVVPWTPASRVFYYDYSRNTISAEGIILVCPGQFKIKWSDGTCLDANEKNAWQQLAWTIPKGYMVTGIDYRFPGSGAYRLLVVYMDPVE